MNSKISDSNANINSKEQLASSVDLHRLEAHDYLDFYEVFLFFKRSRIIIGLLVGMGFITGAIVNHLLPQYYESTIDFKIDDSSDNVVKDTKIINTHLIEIFRHKPMSEAFTAAFFEALQSPDQDAAKTSSYNYFIKKFAAQGSENFAANTLLEQTKSAFTRYMMNNQISYLRDATNVPGSGFLFYIAAVDGQWRLTTRFTEPNLVNSTAFATIAALNRVIDLYNSQLYSSALSRYENKLAQYETILKTLEGAEKDLGLLEAEKLKLKFDLLSIENQLPLLTTNAKSKDRFPDDETTRVVLTANPASSSISTGTTSSMGADVNDLVNLLIENKILRRTNSLLESKAISNEQSEKILSKIVTYRLNKDRVKRKIDEQFALVHRARSDYSETMLEMKVNIKSRIVTLGHGKMDRERIAEAAIFGTLDAKTDNLLRLLVGGSTLGFILACGFALIRQSLRKRKNAVVYQTA